MSRDPIVDEVRRAREREAAKHSFDVKAILAAREEAPAPVRTPGRFRCPKKPEVERLR